MYNMKNVLAAANEQVARLMNEGYMISFGDSSFGHTFRVDLENGESHVRVKVEENHGFGSADTVVLSVITISEADDFERKDAEVLYVKTWYIVERLRERFGRWLNNYLLTEDKDESDTIAEKRYSRRVSARAAYYGMELTPSAALIRSLKKRAGFSNATRNNISVKRVEKGYEVRLKARDGHISRAEIICFPR